MFRIIEILVIALTIDGSEHTVKSSRRGDLKVPNFLPLIFKSWLVLLVVDRFCLRITFHRCVSTTMPSCFIVTFVITRFLAFAKIMRKLLTTITCLRCLLVCRIRGLLHHLYIAIGVEMMALDNILITHTMVSHVLILAQNVQSNMKQMILHNMEIRNWYS